MTSTLLDTVYVLPNERPPFNCFNKYINKDFLIFDDFNAKYLL